MAKKNMFSFSDDELIAIQLQNGALREKVRLIMEDAYTKVTAELLAVRKMEGEHDMTFARHVSIAQAVSECMLFGTGYVYGRIMPIDVGAVYVASLLHDFCHGYTQGTGGACDVEFKATVSVPADKPEVQAAVKICAIMAPMYVQTITAFREREKNGAKPDRPSSENKIV